MWAFRNMGWSLPEHPPVDGVVGFDASGAGRVLADHLTGPEVLEEVLVAQIAEVERERA